MTRAHKLAVTVWGVMALSGCAVMRNHDKPNSSNARNVTYQSTHPSANRNAKPVNKTAASYVRGRDDLEKKLKAQALDVLEAPLPLFQPIAQPVTAFEKYTLADMKIGNLSFDDTAYTARAQTIKASFSTGTLIKKTPYVDVDEILHKADKDGVDFLQYTGTDDEDYVLAVRDLRTLRTSYAQGVEEAERAGAKLYILFQSEPNAFHPDPINIRTMRAAWEKSHALVTTGFLESRSINMGHSTMRHERGHDATEPVFQRYVTDYILATPGEELRNGAKPILTMSRYIEFMADSMGFAADLREPGALDADPGELGMIQYFKVDYQVAKERINGFAYVTGMSDALSRMPQVIARYEANKKSLNAMRSFDAGTVNTTHPGNLNRIYYLLIEQKRAKELKERGKTVLYEQYGDLLPQRPTIVATTTLTPPHVAGF